MKVVVKDVNGLHARPAGKIAEIAQKHAGGVFLIKNELRYNAKSIINLISMGVLFGDVVLVDVEDDEDGMIGKRIASIIEGDVA